MKWKKFIKMSKIIFHRIVMFFSLINLDTGLFFLKRRKFDHLRINLVIFLLVYCLFFYSYAYSFNKLG